MLTLWNEARKISRLPPFPTPSRQRKRSRRPSPLREREAKADLKRHMRPV